MDKKLNLVWVVKNEPEKSAKTAASLAAQTKNLEEIHLVLCMLDGASRSESWVKEIEKKLSPDILEGTNRAAVLNQAVTLLDAPDTTFIVSGDTFQPDYLATMLKAWKKKPEYAIVMSVKQFVVDTTPDVHSIGPEGAHKRQYVDFNHTFHCLPHFLAGTWLRTELLKQRPFQENLPLDFEREFLLWNVIEQQKMLFVNTQTYLFDEAPEDNRVYYPGCYRSDWYYESIDNFWMPFLEAVYEKYGELPRIIQYQALYTLRNRIEANVNNKDKHCVPVEEAVDYVMSWERMLRHVDDMLIMNCHSVRGVSKNPFFQRMLLRVKYQNPDMAFEEYFSKGKLFFGYANTLSTPQTGQRASIQFMEYKDGKLLVDGIIPNIYDFERGHFYLLKDHVPYEIRLTNRYAHTKIFGNSVYKSVSFEVEVPINLNKDRQQLDFRYTINDEDFLVELYFDSHFSRLSSVFQNSYWEFRAGGKRFIAQYDHRRIVIRKVRRREVIKQELSLWKEMLFPSYAYRQKVKKKAESDPDYVPKKLWKFVLLRMAYFFMQKFWKRRPIWLFIDKIYKAGDSSEYLYRYASEQKDGIDKYYLIDKNVPDYQRFVKEGIKPLVRDSLKHKLIFMYADMVVISNSTVFAFNGYTMEESAFVRDLFHFDVACVQHGMSVQKIAIAQNRMRDNISLYFCASKYELDNLNRPIYDYAGRDILKLTGVPRYDGLVNEDKKQLLITPTWRMQAAMPVTTSESHERDYNPMFKETNYYKVYNSLVNDPRLLEAARQYGYRIHYVLHPIVSPQADDFDKNDVVDIIPATGDMSYEKEFRESSLMVSDFSGVQFDFAYMRKPVVYLHHNDIPQHYEEGTFHYDTMAFGEICHTNDELIDVLIDYMRNDCRMKEQYRRRADDFFEFSDRNNCQRIYDVMIQTAKKKRRRRR